MNSNNQPQEYWLNLIVDYLTGSISTSSCRELEEWLAASEENRSYFQELQEVWKSMGIVNDMATFNNDKAFQLFKGRVQADRPGRKKIYALPRRALSYAAVIIPFLILSYFTFAYFTGDDNQYLQDISKIEVPNGSKSQIELKDGTKVWLNAGSTLQFNEDFGKAERKVTLYGEASFEVARNEELPFIVATGEVDIRVLGTTFNVNTYQESGEIKVALLEGSVELLSDAGESIRMKPGNMAIYHTGSRKIEVREGGISNAFGWRDNLLIFEGESFAQIVHVLERTYNVHIRIHNEELKSRQFAGDFVNNSIEQVMSIVSTRQNFTYKIDGNQIDIY